MSDKVPVQQQGNASAACANGQQQSEHSAAGTPDHDASTAGVRAASPLSSVFTLCNSAVGAGVLALPFAFSQSGVVGGLLLCLILGSCEAFTLYVLSKFAERYQAPSYSELVRRALGRKLAASLSTIQVVYLWGSCVAYILIAGDVFAPLIGAAVNHEGWPLILADRRAIIVAVAVLVILPMCFLRRLGALKWVSMAAVVGFLYTAAVIVLRGIQAVAERKPQHHFDGVSLFQWHFSALFAVPIVVFGFNCHANVITIFNELESKPTRLITALPAQPSDYHRLPSYFTPRPKTLKMIGMITVIICTLAVVMTGYLAVGVAGYLAFPRTIASNALNSFPQDDPLLQVARAVIGLVVIGHYPLSHHPARLAAEDLEKYFFGWTTLSTWFTSLQTIVFVGTSIATALFAADLGSVLHMIGGTCASYMIFFLPGLLLMNAAIIKLSSQADLARTSGEDSSLTAPLLLTGQEQGIKRVGLIYSPRNSWWAGLLLMILSISIFAVTVVTAIV